MAILILIYDLRKIISGTRSSLEYRNNSDFPRSDMEKLFRAQQTSGRSEWCGRVAATVPSDEPTDQPSKIK